MSEGDLIERFGPGFLGWVWEHREALSKIFKVNRWFRNGKEVEQRQEESSNKITPKPVLILGPGGVGKSTVARILAGDFDAVLGDHPGKYKESRNLERFNLKTDSNVGIIVAPGQAHRRPGTWDELYRQIGSGTYRGIILLNAFGYHTFGLGYKKEKVFEGLSKPRTKRKFLNAYLEGRRSEELRVIRNLSHHVQLCQDKLWVLTLVAKQDLWWEARNLVSRHYLQGVYEAEVLDMLGQYDPRNRRHETAFASLVINNFRDGESELIQPNTAGYDYREQADSLGRLFDIVTELMKWEQT